MIVIFNSKWYTLLWGEKMLEIKNINKSYKAGDFKQKVLKNVSIKFRKNELV